MRSRSSIGMVEMSASYASDAPFASVTVFAPASTAVTRKPSSPVIMRAAGSFAARRDQMPPVPPWTGKRNVAFGPQPASSVLFTTLPTTRFKSTVATRSPVHSVDMRRGGTAHTLKLYGRMKMSQMPLPNWRPNCSSKLVAFVACVTLHTSMSPWRHSMRDSGGRRWMLFWNGYGTHTPFTRTHDSRWCESHASVE